jgi:methyl-accepting chemotaxis protein
MTKVNTQHPVSIGTKFLALKLRTKFTLLMGFMLASFVVAGYIGNMALSKVLVNGPVYKDIISNKDLVADILPPPAYLLESWQVALEMTAIKNQPIQPLIERSNQLAKDFFIRGEYWDKTITDPKMLSIIQSQLLPSGKEFLRIKDTVFIPAINSRDPKLIDSALLKLKVAYGKHRAAVDELANLANEQSKVIEFGVNSAVSKSNITMLSLVILALSLTIAGIFFVVSRVTRQLGAEPDDIRSIANHIAVGDLSSTIILSDNDNTSAMFAMRAMQNNIKLLVSDAASLSKSAIEGHLSVRADVSKHQGDFKKVIEGVNATLNAIVEPLNMAAAYVDNLSKGVIPKEITESYNGDFIHIKNNLNACGLSIKALVTDGNLLAQAAEAGDLKKRADAAKHLGEYRKVIEGLNASIDAMVGPLNMAAGYVDSLSKGVIPSEITTSYNGDFNFIKNNLNACGHSIKALVADGNLLAQAAEDGDLKKRADTSKHLGEYRKVIDGLNATLDAIAKPLNMAAINLESIAHGDVPTPITELFNGDFNRIKDNLNTCIKSINALVADTDMLSAAAREGQIQTRADATKHQGDFRKIIEGVNETLETIVEPIIAIKTAVETIHNAAGEISLGNNDLSNRTEQQASTLQETAASMEEMASTVKQNAENAKQANLLAHTASNVAIKGGEVVAGAVATMSAINASAKKIENIISVIDGIAFQTNILALNAAVEAARAGEQGKGFAVVADEVRNLAARSASAAKEIKELINDSVTKTAEGTVQVENAGSTMLEVVTSVKRVADIISEISAASGEQSQGINQVNDAVTSMDETTQQNAALVEQAAAAALSLVDQANALTEVISTFKLQGNDNKQKQSPISQMRELVNKPALSTFSPFSSKKYLLSKQI